jgi:hypothetical protein
MRGVDWTGGPDNKSENEFGCPGTQVLRVGLLTLQTSNAQPSNISTLYRSIRTLTNNLVDTTGTPAVFFSRSCCYEDAPPSQFFP